MVALIVIPRKIPVSPGEAQPEDQHIDLDKAENVAAMCFGKSTKQLIMISVSDDGILHTMPPPAASKITKVWAMVSQMVAVPGTAEAISATSLLVTSAVFQAKQLAAVNAGDVTWGDSTVEQTVKDGPIVSPGESFELNARAGEVFDLADIYVDAANAGDGFVVNYLPA